jgi:hypothetical protein
LVVMEFINRVINFSVEMVDVRGNEVGQVTVLRVIPALFDRIQLRAIGRQPLELKPIGMIFVEVGCRRAMHRPAIPHQDHPTTAIIVQFFEKPDGLVGIDIFRRDLKI